VAKYREKHPAKVNIHPVVKALRGKESELDVIFPEAYIRALKSKNWNQIVTRNSVYQIIPPERLSLLVGYDRDLPWLVKAVPIAENGCGDYLTLALKKENFCELGNEIYEVLHEMGTAQKIGTLNNL
ncbi:MAG: SMI1/KNR4 family protein, partial [Saprospiraceae bacterium]|nr:SMI1/KNR4 family protein [Saprospiraceae bacterium]